MSDSDVLTQQEIDALLSQEPEPAETEEAVAARPYRLGREEGLSNGRLAGLSVVADRFALAVAESLWALFKCEVTVGGMGTETRSFGEVAAEAAPPSAAVVFHLAPFHGQGIQVLDVELIRRLVDHYFAGPGWDGEPGRTSFSPSERRLAERLGADLLTRFASCWNNVLPVQPDKVADGDNLTLLNHHPNDERLLWLTFTVNHADWQASVRIGLPEKGIAEYRTVLQQTVPADDPDRSARWRARLMTSLLDAELPLHCCIARTELRLREVVALGVGDVLDADMPEVHRAYAGPVPVLKGSLGESRGRLALEVTDIEVGSNGS
ncbi:MAG: FliM/FliN family flagellar motor switch protein [Pseudomonadota bacterium]